MKFFILVFLGFFLVMITPFSLGGLFLSLLVVRSLAVGLRSGFVGLILFIVYVGGTIVLFTYCFMLSPRQIFRSWGRLYPVMVGGLGGFLVWESIAGLPYEFYWVSNLLVLIGLLLFIVMLRVVEIVDFSRGSIRVECNLKFLYP